MLKVKVENPKGPIVKPFSYVRHQNCLAPIFFSYLCFSSFFALNHIFWHNKCSIPRFFMSTCRHRPSWTQICLSCFFWFWVQYIPFYLFLLCLQIYIFPLYISTFIYLCVFFSSLHFPFFCVYKFMFFLFAFLCLSFFCLWILPLSFLFANLHLSSLCPYVCCLSSLRVCFFHLYILPFSFVFANLFFSSLCLYVYHV